MPQSWGDLLSACCVEVHGEDRGTGFFATPGFIVTCAHVIGANTRKGEVVRCTRGSNDLETVLVNWRLDEDIDVAVLAPVKRDPEQTCCCLDPDSRIGDSLYGFGFPEHTRGDGVTGTYEARTQRPRSYRIKFKDAQVEHGFSGGPLLNIRTQRVIGVICWTRNTALALGGWAIPVDDVFESSPALRRAHDDFHRENATWRTLEEPSPGKVTILAPRVRLFLHNLDHFVLSLCGWGRVPARNRAIERECHLALRFALLASEEVLIPAVSYVQSPVCRSLVDAHKDLFDLGFITLVGDAPNWDAFVGNRLREYSAGAPEANVYATLRHSAQILPPLIGADRNTTAVLHDAWDELGEEGSRSLWADSNVAVQKDYAGRFFSVREALGSSAFVAANLLPLLFEQWDSRSYDRLVGKICQLFFSTFLREYKPAIMKDLVYTNAVELTGETYSLSYRTMLRELRRTGDELLEDVRNCTSVHLMLLREDAEIRRVVMEAIST